jgi:hypothetical protein
MRLARGFSLLFSTTLVSVTAMTWASAAAAQQEQPLPPLPSQAPQYAPPQPQPYYQQQPAPYYQQQPGYGQPQYAPPPPPPYYGAPPPPTAYAEPPEPPTHAPKFSLWTGVRFGYLGFGGGFYGVVDHDNPLGDTHTETAGNLVSPGATMQLDVGARLGRRYVLFGFYEHSFLHPGHRFEGNPNASAYTELYGGGFRYTAGDVDTAGFLTELSIGERTVAVSDGSSTYKLQALEFFKLGLGAEIRLSTLFVLSPLASISTGAMTDTSGNVGFSNAVDKNTTPRYHDGASIDDQRGYVMVSLTIGGHFDVFGK